MVRSWVLWGWVGLFGVLFFGGNVCLGTGTSHAWLDVIRLGVFSLECMVVAGCARWLRGKDGADRVASLILLGMLALSAGTTYAHHGDSFFALHSAWGFAGLFMVCSAWVLWVRREVWHTGLLALLFVGGEVLAMAALIHGMGGEAIYSDDHPSFLFRLQEFWVGFPWREHYVPHWNAGWVSNVLTSSGVPGYALLTAPLRLFSSKSHEWHTWGLGWVQAFVAPWMVVWGFRACRVSWRTTWVGALLALCTNRAFFLWTFHFGTVGAGVSWALAPAALLFLFAMMELGRTEWSTVLGLVLSCVLLCLWPQQWIFAGFLGVAALTSWRRWLRNRCVLRVSLLALGLIGACLAPSVWAVLRERALLGYVAQSGVNESVTWRSILRVWASRTAEDLVMRIHPIVLIFGFCGLVTLPQRVLRRWLWIVMIGSMLAYSVGVTIAPNMQLHRISIPLAMVLVIPAAFRLERIGLGGGVWAVPLRGAVLALLVLGVANTAYLYHGEGSAPFEPIPPAIHELSTWIAEHVPQNSRVLFAGPARHAYGHGHIAYLPILSGREMMACDFYAFPVGTYEDDCPPKAARTGPGGLYGYMLRHGVSHVVTCRANYRRLFASESERYERVATFVYPPRAGDPVEIDVFRVLGATGVFLEGAGEVSSTFDRISVKLVDPKAPIRLAYHWNERLRVPAPVRLEPYPTEDEETFLSIDPNGVNEFEIVYENRL